MHVSFSEIRLFEIELSRVIQGKKNCLVLGQ